MTIDAKELREAIALLRREAGAWGPADYRDAVRKAVDAADAYAAPLPREVERVAWEVVAADGTGCGIYEGKSFADESASRVPGRQVVRLTGRALLPPQKD